MTPPSVHEMVCEAETSSEALLVCTTAACGRRVVVGKTRPRMTIVDQGDFMARHAWSLGGMSTAEVAMA
jgi:hypothetical protein